MKLLFFASTLKGGGAERVLSNLVNELVIRGHDITIALNTNQIGYEIHPMVKIIVAPPRQWYVGRNIIHRYYHNLVKIHYYALHTRKVIRDIQPDVIITFLHCNMGAILRYHGNIPIVHSEHNAFDREINLQYYFERFFLNRFFDKVFVLTPFDQGYALAKGLRNTIVMPNPNSFVSITKEEYEELYPKRKNILVCGRIQWWHIKGIDIAIEAFAKTADKLVGIDLDIVGYGDDVSINHLKQLAIEYNVGKRVHFLGQHSDIQNIMQQHKVFLLSSRTEGFPMVVTEAMSQGLPCITFERLASSIIMDHIDGCLVKNGDINALAEMLYYILSHEDKCYLYGAEGIKNVNRFSSKAITKRWEEHLRISS